MVSGSRSSHRDRFLGMTQNLSPWLRTLYLDVMATVTLISVPISSTIIIVPIINDNPEDIKTLQSYILTSLHEVGAEWEKMIMINIIYILY